MVSNINYDYSELVSYYQGVYVYQGKPLDFTIVKITDVNTKELIDLSISFTRKIDNEVSIKDEILKHFNKSFK